MQGGQLSGLGVWTQGPGPMNPSTGEKVSHKEPQLRVRDSGPCGGELALECFCRFLFADSCSSFEILVIVGSGPP